MTDDLRASSEWKLHLRMKINFTPSKESGESQSLHSKSDDIELWLLIMLMKLLMSFLVHLLLNTK